MPNTHYASGTSNLADAIGALDSQLYGLNNRIRRFKKEFKSGMASLSAMSALVPNVRHTGDTQITIGTGAYDGHTAAAIGGFHWINDNAMLNIGASWGNSSHSACRFGFTYSF